MATINYNGMELKEVTEPQIFDPPKKCVVFDSYDEKKSVIRNVVAVLPASFNECGGILSVITEEKQYWKHCAILPDPPKPRRATNRELARWLAQGNGEYTNPKSDYYNNYSSFSYEECDKDNEIYANFKVRKWSDTEWHEPTVEYLSIDDKDYNFNKKYGEV
jgi:hypothetical protein